VRPRSWLAGLLAAGAALAEPAPDPGALGFLPPLPGSYSLPPLGEVGDGEVLTSGAEPARLRELLGDKLVVLSFVYTSCSDANGCPLAIAVLDRVRRRVGEAPDLAGRVRLLTLSFDPSHDTPEVMRRTERSLAGPGASSGVEWRFLTTASQAELAPILAAYGQSLVREPAAPGSAAGAIAHVLRVFLIDGADRIRNIYSASFLHPETLVADLRTLRLEEERGQARETRDAAPAAGRGRPADLLARVRAAPLGLPPLPVPADNPLTAEKVALGRKLFFDRRLSLNGTFSCAMCHIPEQGFTSNEAATAIGIEGRTVRRNAPTLYDVAYLPRLFLDGRETRLEHQVWGPLLARNEMGNPSIGAVLESIRRAPDYAGLFEAAFPGRGLALESVGMALASYERTLVSGGSPFDRWYYGEEEGALGAAAQRGFRLFTGEAACSSCHPVGPEHALFSDGDLHNTGIGTAAAREDGSGQRLVQISPGRAVPVERSLIARVSEPAPSDLGRSEVTRDPADRWKFRTPTLRNVALTAPYMHDGSLGSLREVVAFYDRGGVANEGLDPRIRPLGLSRSQRDDLVAFLESLTGGDLQVLVSDAFAAPIGDVREPEPAAPGQRISSPAFTRID